MTSPTDLTGHRFGRLVAVKRMVHPSYKRRTIVWNCQCDCGSTTFVTAGNLRSGMSKSCGCGREVCHRVHGKSKTVEYHAWRAMRDRCYNASDKRYKDYGARGISVNPEWRPDFRNFLRDMGPRPPGTSLDRVDNNGDYCKWNCRWATAKEQARNTRSNRMLVIGGVTKCISEWAEQVGIHQKSFKGRLDSGWPIDKILVGPTK